MDIIANTLLWWSMVLSAIFASAYVGLLFWSILQDPDKRTVLKKRLRRRIRRRKNRQTRPEDLTVNQGKLKDTYRVLKG